MAKEKTSVSVTPPPDHEMAMEWSPEDEIQLFFALDGLKICGVNKYFHMFFIAQRLSQKLQREIDSEAIWSHLRTIYNLDVLDESEPLPFPNEVKDFSLPEDFSALLSKKRAESEEKRLSDSSTDTVGKERSSKSSSSNIKEMEKKLAAKLSELPKRSQKRTRGSISLESSSPSTTPPPVLKRRRI